MQKMKLVTMALVLAAELNASHAAAKEVPVFALSCTLNLPEITMAVVSQNSDATFMFNDEAHKVSGSMVVSKYTGDSKWNSSIKAANGRISQFPFLQFDARSIAMLGAAPDETPVFQITDKKQVLTFIKIPREIWSTYFQSCSEAN